MGKQQKQQKQQQQKTRQRHHANNQNSQETARTKTAAAVTKATKATDRVNGRGTVLCIARKTMRSGLPAASQPVWVVFCVTGLTHAYFFPD